MSFNTALQQLAAAMIDNYCEHEWNFQEIMKKIVLNPGESFPVQCKKCGVPYKS